MEYSSQLTGLPVDRPPCTAQTIFRLRGISEIHIERVDVLSHGQRSAATANQHIGQQRYRRCHEASRLLETIQPVVHL